MPTYEYECRSCKYTFDVFQSMRDEPLKICPKCGKEVRRLIFGGNGVIFKGNGFYVNDKNVKGGKSAIEGEGANSGAKSEKSGDSAKTAPAESAPCAGCAKSETPACPKAAS